MNLLRRLHVSRSEGLPVSGLLAPTWYQLSEWFSGPVWGHLPRRRFILAATSSAVLLAGAVTVGMAQVHQSATWTKVFANGAYVGLVPNHPNVIQAIQRVAIGYHVNVSLSPVHTAVADGYNWKRVQSLPMPAIALAIGGRPVVYMATKDAATQVIADVKAALMPKTITGNLQATFVQPIQLLTTTVSVASILTPLAALEHILHPTGITPSSRSIGLEAIVNTSLSEPQSAHRRSLPASTSYQTVSEVQSMGGTDILPEFQAGVGKSRPLMSLRVTEMFERTVRLVPPVRYIKESTWPVGRQKIVRSGRSGLARERVRLEFINGNLHASTLEARKVLSAPTIEIVQEGTNNGVATGSWGWPSPYTDITSPFGWRLLLGASNFHPGVDIGCPVGTPIYATNDGVVQDAGWNSGGYGIWALIDNGNGVQSVYGHMSQVLVSPGETLFKGQLIGYSGETGFATGPHLHYEIRVNGTAVNPQQYM